MNTWRHEKLIIYLFFVQMWLSFSPVPSLTAIYYGITLSDVDMFSIIFFILSLVMGLVAIFLLDKFGLKIPVSLVGVIAEQRIIVNEVTTVNVLIKVLPLCTRNE